MGIALGAAPAEAQPCYLNARAGLAFSSAELPYGDGVELESGSGAVLAAGFDCGSVGWLGADLEIHVTEARRILYFLFGGGLRLVGGQPRSPWVMVVARAGPFLSHDRRGPIADVGRPGEFLEVDDEGLALGGGLRAGLAVGERWSLFAEGSARVVSLTTRTFEGGGGTGSLTEVRFPLTVGARFRL